VALTGSSTNVRFYSVVDFSHAFRSDVSCILPAQFEFVFNLEVPPCWTFFRSPPCSSRREESRFFMCRTPGAPFRSCGFTIGSPLS